MNTEHFEEATVIPVDAPAATTTSLSVTKLDNFGNMDEMLDYAGVLLKGKLVPQSIKTPESLVSIALMGKELGMDAMASLNNIVVIQGRPTLGIHAIGALLRKADCAWKTLEDFVPILGEPGTENAGKPVDYRTTVRFFRPYRNTVLEEDVSFTWKDAAKMDLTTKDNWKRMPKIMLYSRCFSLGARRVAPDALLGMYETAEWAEVAGVKHTVAEDGEATIVG